MKRKNILWLVVSIIMILAVTLVSGCGWWMGTSAKTTPTVSSTVPANAATDVAINQKIAATFSEAMDPLTITANTFTLKKGTTPVTGTVTYVGVTATFTPAASLATNTVYTATITTGAKVLTGKALAGKFVWSFTTGAAPDTTAPTVSSTIPEGIATDVAINSKISGIFSEAMDPLYISANTFTLKKGTTPVAGTVTYVGVTATFTPAANLAANTEYTATITAGAKDLAGNALAGSFVMANDFVWSFTTSAAPDTTAPTMSSTVPAIDATGVAINFKPTAIFSKAMDPLTITATTFTLKKGTTPVAGTVTYVGLTATFTPAANLAANTEYTATITTGAKDLAGNALASDSVWSFKTGAAPDTTAPTVRSTVPENAATGVSASMVASKQKIDATFSKAMDPLTITATTFTLKKGITPVAGTVTYVGATATFTPEGSKLEYNTEYTATITTGAKDLAGNALTSNFVWRFTTGAASGAGGGGGGGGDTTAPTVISTIPANAAPSVAVDSNIVITFSEAMKQTETNAAFSIAPVVAGSMTWNIEGKIATFNPTSDLAPGTEYTVTITTGAKDLAGNALAVPKVWSFTTEVPLPENPTAPVLGETSRFVILASQKVTTTGVTAISGGDIGIEDQARSYYEGFTAGPAPGQFIELTNGLSYAHDDIDPALIPAPYASTIAFLNQVRTDLGIAYTYLAADPNPGAPTQVCPADLGGLTLTRGVYKTAVGVTIPTELHLDAQGDPDSVWIFSIDGNLTTGATGNIFLDNGALPENVYWRVAGITTIAGGTTFYGNVFSWQQVNVLAGADITGRLFSVNEQVTLISDTVTKAP